MAQKWVGIRTGHRQIKWLHDPASCEHVSHKRAWHGHEVRGVFLDAKGINMFRHTKNTMTTPWI